MNGTTMHLSLISREAQKLIQVKDICHTLSAKHPNTKYDITYGYLRKGTTQERPVFDVFFVRPSDDNNQHTMIHLSGVFSQTSRPSRTRRYHIAATAAFNVLLLYDTSWLPATLTIQDVFMISRNGNVDFNEIYLTKTPLHDFEGSAIIPKNDSSNEKARVLALYHLGIFLMGIMLWKPTHEYWNNEDVDISAVSPDAIIDPATTRGFARIKEVLKQIEFITTPNFKKPPEHCIKYDFNTEKLSLDNNIFRQAIYHGIVFPLQEGQPTDRRKDDRKSR